MRKRFIFAALCILALPLLFSPSQSGEFTRSTSSTTVAFAGRTTMGNWCSTPCCYGCIPDEGEQCVPCMQSTGAVSDRPAPNGRVTVPAKADPSFGLDFGSGALMFALAFFVWARLRGSGF